MIRLLFVLAVLVVAAVAAAGCIGTSDSTVSAVTPAPVGPGVPYVGAKTQYDATISYDPSSDEDEVRFECRTGDHWTAYDGAPGAPVSYARPLPGQLTYRLHDANGLSNLNSVEVTVVRGAVVDHYTIRI